MRMAPIGLSVWMLGQQGVELLEMIRKTRRRGLIGGGVALLEEA